ncbi:MAG TPA: GGDEF domain-containing protein [Thermoanaerobaculia bacterium]
MASEGTAVTSEEDGLSILAECTAIIYRRRPGALLSHVPVALLAIAVGWEPEVRLSNFLLNALLLTYVVTGIRSARSFNARPLTDAGARRGALELYLTLPLLGLLYNLIFLNLERNGVPHALAYQLLVISLFCAGAAANYQHLRGLAVLFIVFSAVPLSIFHLVRGGREGHVMALLLGVFVVFMSSVSLGLHRDAIERIELTRQLKASKEAAEHQAAIDGLTGLLNRRAFFEIGSSLVAVANRHDRPLSLVMIDLDHFKSINDRFGHSAGDSILAGFADTLRRTERASDVSARLGGEEFAVLLPETTAVAATQFAERLADAVRGLGNGGSDPVVGVTASFGVAERQQERTTLDSLIDRADRALYRAKSEGRDRVVIEEESGRDDSAREQRA